MALIVADCGGIDVLSEAKLAVIKRACVMIVELEQRELKFAEHGATDLQLEQYSRVAANLRRMLESVGLERVPKNVVPTVKEYIRSINQEEADAA
jgi:hypothetical protein